MSETYDQPIDQPMESAETLVQQLSDRVRQQDAELQQRNAEVQHLMQQLAISNAAAAQANAQTAQASGSGQTASSSIHQAFKPLQLKISEPKKFTGKRDGSVETFVYQMRSRFAAADSSSAIKLTEEQKVRYMIDNVEGSVLDFYRANMEPQMLVPGYWQQPGSTFEAAAKILCDFFGALNKDMHARDDLDRLCTRRQQGSLQHFTAEFLRILVKIKPELHESEKKSRYYYALKEQLKDKIRLETKGNFLALSFLELCSLADLLSQTDRHNNRQQHEPSRHQQYQQRPQQGPTPMEIGAVGMKRGDRKSGSPWPRGQNRDRSNSPQWRNNRRDSRSPPRRGRLSDSELDYLYKNNGCFYCRALHVGPDHTWQNCPVKAQNEARKPESGKARPW